MLRRFVLGLFIILMSARISATVVSPCTDVCLQGASGPSTSCALWSAADGCWISSPSSEATPGMLSRARAHTSWLHAWMMPAGGIMATQFADATLGEVLAYGGRRDSAIWTGTYLAAEALRFMATGAPDADRWMRETLTTLHRWWNIPGDAGYLARYAAPADSPEPIQAILPAEDSEVHRDAHYEGGLWHWRGNISRDQYQGVILGYSLAYEATRSPAMREIIRQDVVEFVEQLMRSADRPVRTQIGDHVLDLEVSIPYAVFIEAEAPGGEPTLSLSLDPVEAAGEGVLFFTPDLANLIRQLPAYQGFPSLPQPTESIQLGAMFRVALQVTAGIPAYAERRQAIADHYARHADEWIDNATGWRNTNRCDSGYFGLNIGFMPLYSWIRLETDPERRARLQREVLRDALWAEVADHKNVFFGFIYASQAPAEDDVQPVVAEQVQQLAGFPDAPNLARAVDLRDSYPESETCPGISAVAVDVDQRVPATFMWERQPWKLYDPGTPNQVYGGLDYLMAYWMGRYYGYIEDDQPGTCLLWRRN